MADLFFSQRARWSFVCSYLALALDRSTNLSWPCSLDTPPALARSAAEVSADELDWGRCPVGLR
jgi:hypothetical protein